MIATLNSPASSGAGPRQCDHKTRKESLMAEEGVCLLSQTLRWYRILSVIKRITLCQSQFILGVMDALAEVLYLPSVGTTTDTQPAGDHI